MLSIVLGLVLGLSVRLSVGLSVGLSVRLSVGLGRISTREWVRSRERGPRGIANLAVASDIVLKIRFHRSERSIDVHDFKSTDRGCAMSGAFVFTGDRKES